MFLSSYRQHQQKRLHLQRMGLLKFFHQKLNVLSLSLMDLHKVWEIRTILMVMKWYCQRIPSFHMLRGYHLIQLGYFWTGMELKKILFIWVYLMGPFTDMYMFSALL
jgi:hypothetical protein